MAINLSIEINSSVLKQLGQAAELAAEKTMDAVLTEVKNAGTMPRETGNMQNGGTYEKTGVTVSGNQVETAREGHAFQASLVNDAPQARRLYFHPEYDFQQGHNANAGARWMDEYLEGGSKVRFIPETFCELLKKGLNP